jgi:predicted N-acetyltransferase YhbS
MTGWTIRPERPGDEAAIHDVTEIAFANHAHSDGTEPAIIEILRATGELTLSLVAEAEGMVVGHVAFSPALLSNGAQGWQTLGPISVHPDWQHQGIGRALIEAGSAHWRGAGGQGIVLVGSPDLYGRFGFVRGTPLHLEGPLAEYFQVLAFADAIPAASVDFAPAFSAAGR